MPLNSDSMLAVQYRKDHMISHVIEAQPLGCIGVNKISHGLS